MEVNDEIYKELVKRHCISCENHTQEKFADIIWDKYCVIKMRTTDNYHYCASWKPKKLV